MPLNCPSTERLQAAITGHLTEADQAEVDRHLDTCPHCQKIIEQLAVGSSRIIQHAQMTPNQPQADSAFWKALASVEEDIKNNLTAIVSSPPLRKSENPPPPKNSTPQSSGAYKKNGASSASKIRKPTSLLDELPFIEPTDEEGALGYLHHFKVLSVVGRGGMGIVLESFDTRLSRTVAIKVLDPQLSKNELAQGRFCREARAAAAVGHENVVTIHHVEHEEERGLSYIVMHFVRGRSLQDILDMGETLPIVEVVRIAAAVASGLAAAHANHLIHRDVKPANILIDKQTGRVMLTDFGLARGHEDVKLTQTGFVAGTPLYMSPEQARGEVIVDPRSDLFSLGGVLYAMLTGRPPFNGNSAFAVLRGVTDQPHRPVQELRADTPDWLANLIDRLLAKSPVERPSSALEVANFLNEQYVRLASNPKKTSKIGILGRSRRRTWLRRNAVRFLATVGSLGLLLGVTEATQLTQWTLIGQRGSHPTTHEDPNTLTGLDLVKSGPEPLYQTTKQTGSVLSIAYSPKSDIMATALEDGTVKFWEPSTGWAKGYITLEFTTPVWSISFDNEGSHLAIATEDGYVRVWDIHDRRAPTNSYQLEASARSIAFSPKGDRIVAGTRTGLVTIWKRNDPRNPIKTVGHQGMVMGIAFSPDGKTFATASSDKSVKIWETESGESIQRLKHPDGPVYSVSYSPDGSLLATAGWDGRIRIFDIMNGKLISNFQAASQDIWSVTFSPDGQMVLCASQDQTTRVFSVAEGKELAVLRWHSGGVHSVACSPDGKYFASGGRDGIVNVWSFDVIK